jgi:hypothetical protein
MMIARMSIELFDRGDGHLEVRGPKAIVRLTELSDGTWIMDDEEARTFSDRGGAIDAARKISGEFPSTSI